MLLVNKSFDYQTITVTRQTLCRSLEGINYHLDNICYNNRLFGQILIILFVLNLKTSL